MAVYFDVLGYSIRAGGNGGIDFDVRLWHDGLDAEGNAIKVDVPNGHQTVSIPSEAMATIEAMDKTDNQKLVEVKAIIQAEVRSWGAVEAEEAKDWFDRACPELPLSFLL